MQSSATQYQFLSSTASNFNVVVVIHLALAVLSSVYDADVSAAIAVMGLIGVLNYNVGLLFLYILFAPSSMLVDIVRMVHIRKLGEYKHASSGFFIFLRIAEMIAKCVASYFGYLVYSSASEAQMGYEQINGGPGQSSQLQQTSQDPFQPPTSYKSPSHGPVVHNIPPSS